MFDLRVPQSCGFPFNLFRCHICLLFWMFRFANTHCTMLHLFIHSFFFQSSSVCVCAGDVFIWEKKLRWQIEIHIRFVGLRIRNSHFYRIEFNGNTQQRNWSNCAQILWYLRIVFVCIWNEWKCACVCALRCAESHNAKCLYCNKFITIKINKHELKRIEMKWICSSDIIEHFVQPFAMLGGFILVWLNESLSLLRLVSTGNPLINEIVICCSMLIHWYLAKF